VEVNREVNNYEWKQVRSQAQQTSELALAWRMQTWTEMIQDQMCHRGCGSALLRSGRNKAPREKFALTRQ